MSHFVKLTRIFHNTPQTSDWPFWVNLDQVAHMTIYGDPSMTQLEFAFLGSLVEITAGDRTYAPEVIHVKESPDEILRMSTRTD